MYEKPVTFVVPSDTPEAWYRLSPVGVEANSSSYSSVTGIGLSFRCGIVFW